jgi:hypothetical protein
VTLTRIVKAKQVTEDGSWVFWVCPAADRKWEAEPTHPIAFWGISGKSQIGRRRMEEPWL